MNVVAGGRGRWLPLFLLGWALVTPSPAAAWGAEAHRIICEIAWQHLSPELRNWILDLRSADKNASATFSDSCVWADQVRETTHPETYAYHFVNIPPGVSGVDLQRDCPGDRRCAPWAIHYYLAQLQNKRQPREVRAEALKFLAHFVGDLHQPMHTGRADDRGGNTVFVDFFGQFGSCRKARDGRALSLHETWDDLIVQRAGWRWKTDAPRMAGEIPQAEGDTWANATVLEWANESYRICEDYACTVTEQVEHCNGIPFRKIDEGYYARALKDTELQIKKAGVRLARMIEKAAARDR